MNSTGYRLGERLLTTRKHVEILTTDPQTPQRLADIAGLGPVKECRCNDDGWDSTVFEINGQWMIRVPRRLAVADRMRDETALVVALHGRLPAPIPRMQLFDLGDDLFVAYRKVEGVPISDQFAAGCDPSVLGRDLGVFLTALHSVNGEAGTPLPIRPAALSDWKDEQQAFASRCRAEVYPLLEAGERERAEAIFAALADPEDDFELQLVHADLGPAHVLCLRGRLSGVIDWSNAQLGDPAIDLAWAAHGTPAGFASALRSVYVQSPGPIDNRFWARAGAYHQQGPWFEVLYGLDQKRPELVASGLAGVRKRLP